MSEHHDHSHAVVTEENSKKLMVALGLTTTFLIVEVVAAFITHSLQQPGARSDSAGGRREQITTLARAGMATGLAGLFLEAHPNPEAAKCDGPCALRTSQLEPFLRQLKQIDELVKGFEVLDTQ